jgi:hypothetical protein
MFMTVDVLGLKVDVLVVDVSKINVLELIQMGQPETIPMTCDENQLQFVAALAN